MCIVLSCHIYCSYYVFSQTKNHTHTRITHTHIHFHTHLHYDISHYTYTHICTYITIYIYCTYIVLHRCKLHIHLHFLIWCMVLVSLHIVRVHIYLYSMYHITHTSTFPCIDHITYTPLLDHLGHGTRERRDTGWRCKAFYTTCIIHTYINLNTYMRITYYTHTYMWSRDRCSPCRAFSRAFYTTCIHTYLWEYYVCMHT